MQGLVSARPMVLDLDADHVLARTEQISYFRVSPDDRAVFPCRRQKSKTKPDCPVLAIYGPPSDHLELLLSAYENTESCKTVGYQYPAKYALGSCTSHLLRTQGCYRFELGRCALRLPYMKI